VSGKSLALIGNASGQGAEGARIAPRHFRSRLTTSRTSSFVRLLGNGVALARQKLAVTLSQSMYSPLVAG
jgi:hypothetical protein